MRIVCRQLLVALLLVVQACVTAYEPELTLNADQLVVSGLITDLNEVQTISLSRSRSTVDSGSISLPLQQATVEIIVNGTTTLSLREVQPGVYQLPDGFRGQVGNTYQLRFRQAGGPSYESSVETLTAVPAIARAYDVYNPQGVKPTADGLTVPANEVYIDFQDPAGTRNFYLWRWRLYESQTWCATCQQGYYLAVDVGPVGSGPLNFLGCVRDTTLGSYNLFDYPCRGLCWDIFYNTDIDVFSDIYTNGQSQVGHKVASVPIYQREAALIVIQQLSLSANAYRYYKLFADQIQNTGTLADSPPAPIAGNVRNTANSQENVVGYFSAASVAEINYKMNRQNATSGSFRGLFYALNRRNPVLDYNHPSSAICIPSRTRTDQLPPGWNQ